MFETTKDLREASKAQERLAAVQSAALVGKSLFGTSRLETGSFELLSATVTLTSRGTEFEGKQSHLAQSVGSLQSAQLPWQLEPLRICNSLDVSHAFLCPVFSKAATNPE
ncbi:unnamed protein product [Polarella glacialis]|uniref:Uncharacterized protein n=1 Tax=Polarella glacialis TaxID=89957 RepID=A0A813LBZ2_POLGL|nr:unnamed protein product [Polarella glacialis]